MQTFIARQPIFDAQQKVHAYELMYRSGPDNWSLSDDETQASSKVIADMCLLIGGEQLTEGKKAYVRVTRETLLGGYANMLPANTTVVELHDEIEAKPEVLDACAHLKSAGFELALDVFILRDRVQQLAGMVDVIKVDFLSNSEERQKTFVEDFSARGKKFVAQKVETPESFRRAQGLGYNFFQGYFLSRPTLMAQRDVPAFKLNNLRLLAQINRPDIDQRQVETIIKGDVSLSFKLLRHINSAHFGLPTEIHSIKQALGLLGESALKRWASLIACASMASDKPEELMIQAATRAKFCEAVAASVNLKNRADDLFLMGMFSLLDAILDRPLADILKDMPLAADAKDALLGTENHLHDVYKYVLAYERADWDELSHRAAKLDADQNLLPQIYIESLTWASQNLRTGLKK